MEDNAFWLYSYGKENITDQEVSQLQRDRGLDRWTSYNKCVNLRNTHMNSIRCTPSRLLKIQKIIMDTSA